MRKPCKQQPNQNGFVMTKSLKIRTGALDGRRAPEGFESNLKGQMSNINEINQASDRRPRRPKGARTNSNLKWHQSGGGRSCSGMGALDGRRAPGWLDSNRLVEMSDRNAIRQRPLQPPDGDLARRGKAAFERKTRRPGPYIYPFSPFAQAVKNQSSAVFIFGTPAEEEIGT